MIITPTCLSISQLFGSTNEQYVIPPYQRRYSWHKRQVWELIDDILLLEDGDTHLLGSIVCLAAHHQAGLNNLELVDGQQRLTTITILLEVVRQRMEELGEVEGATEVARLLSSKPLRGKAIRKVALESIDSMEFDRLVQGNCDDDFQNQQLLTAFEIIRGWVGEQSQEELASFLYRLQNQAVVIRLDVSEAKDAFKLFETINNRGLRLSPSDIIKNFLLGNAARFGGEALQSARTNWAALIEYLDGTSSDAFFRYYLMGIVKTRLTASDVVTVFKTAFMNQVIEAAELPERHLYVDVEDPDDEDSSEPSEHPVTEVVVGSAVRIPFNEFMARLVQSAKVYGELVLVKTSSVRLNRHLRNLRMIKAVQTYGFLTHLRVGGCGDKQFREILELTERFVLRRHVCRERANETEALFARLCGVDPKDPLQATKNAYRSLCPSDEKFRDEFATTSFAANLIDRARYCLEQIEVAKHGDENELQVLGAADVHVEHIMPQKIKTKKAKEEFGDWVSYLGKNAEELHPEYVSRIGNLTLFAGALNIGASNNPFARKKKAYKRSAILLTKELTNQREFTFKTIDQRSKVLAAAAVARWPQL
jgi:hypothetical protein